MNFYNSEIFKESCRTKSDLETNILIGEISERDKALFLGPIFDFDTFHNVDPELKYPHLLKQFGFFKSNGQARKNGWDKDIPEGYSEHTIGKLKKKLYVLKNTTGW